MNRNVGLIARREIVSRLQQKGYRIGLGVTLLIAVIAVIVPSFFGGSAKAKSYDIGVATDTGRLASILPAAGQAQQIKVRVHRASGAQARKRVKDGTWDAAVLPGPTIVAQQRGDAVVGFLQTAYADLSVLERLRQAGLSTTQAANALQVQPLNVDATKSRLTSQRQTVAIVTIVVLFSQLITFCTWVATGVVEEKASRVVELLLSSVRPLQLLAGKLLGIGALAAGQVAVLGAAVVIAGTASGTLTLPAADLWTMLISFVAFLLGFAFFAAVSAGLASTVSRQEEVSGVLAPVTVVLTICYLAAFTVAGDDSSGFARIISIVPPVSSIALPARIARGDASLTDVILAIVLLIVSSAVVLALAARIYRASVLHTGARLKLRTAWRGEAVAEIS